MALLVVFLLFFQFKIFDPYDHYAACCVPLRLCYNINIPSDISITRLHENARIEKLCDQRNLFLMCIMYNLYQKGMYEKIANRATRAADGYTFNLTIPNMGVYAKSPYYVGASMWNLLPVNVQN